MYCGQSYSQRVVLRYGLILNINTACKRALQTHGKDHTSKIRMHSDIFISSISYRFTYIQTSIQQEWAQTYKQTNNATMTYSSDQIHDYMLRISDHKVAVGQIELHLRSNTNMNQEAGD